MTSLKELPQGYQTKLLHEVPKDQQKAYLDQIYDLLKQNYGSYAESEDMGKWLKEVYSADNPEPTNRIISVVLGPDGKVAAASAAELYKQEQAVLISYTVGKPGSQGDFYVPLLAASKDKVQQGVEDLQANGVSINIVAQEHKAQKAGHALKIEAGMAVGQTPLELFEQFAKEQGGVRYTIPVYKADVKDGMTYEQIVADASQAHLFLSNIKPSNPDKPFSEILNNFMDGYIRTNSYFADKDSMQDPGLQSIKAFSEWLDNKYPGLTYAQAIQMGETAKNDPNSEFRKVYDKTRKGMETPDLANPASVVSTLFNNRADDLVQNKANDFLRCLDRNSLPPQYQEFYDLALQDANPVAKQMAQKEMGFYFLYKNGDQSPAMLKGGLALYFAAADDVNSFGNLQAKRDIARFMAEGGINGKSFETLKIDDAIKQDKFRALEIIETTIAEARLGEKYNSYAKHDGVMNSLTDLRTDIKADPDISGKGFDQSVRAEAKQVAASM